MNNVQYYNVGIMHKELSELLFLFVLLYKIGIPRLVNYSNKLTKNILYGL